MNIARRARVATAFVAAVSTFVVFATAVGAGTTQHVLYVTDVTGHIMDVDEFRYDGPDLDIGGEEFTATTDMWDPTRPVSDAKVTYFHDGVHLRAELVGFVLETPDCGYGLWATFRYADGGETTGFEYQATLGRDCPVRFEFDSEEGRDVVSVGFRASNFEDDKPTKEIWAGDAPDSAGTAARLDSDPLNVVSDNAALAASTVYSISDGAVRSRVTGRLTWTAPGRVCGYDGLSQIRARIQWTGAGVTSEWVSAAASRPTEWSKSVEFDQLSPSLTLQRNSAGQLTRRQVHAYEVKVFVEVSDGRNPWAWCTYVHRKFGDHTG